jgi:BA14K-like protein
MFGALRFLSTVTILTLLPMGAALNNASALTLQAHQQSTVLDIVTGVDKLYQSVHYVRERRQYRRSYTRRITLGINRARCHSPEWNWIYRHDGLEHQPRHHYTPDGTFYYYDPFWDFQPWWCDDPQIVRRQHDYPSNYRGTSKSAVAHVQWCSDRYQSYDPRFNTWIGANGRRYQCDSPYDWR